jgi:MinD-like ATPase involved in chromosome partitioning or flagellar assembly
MTERESADDRDYPDGSVGRYVRERWGATPARAARPHVVPAESPAPRPEPEVETFPRAGQPSASGDADTVTPPSGAAAVPPPRPGAPGGSGPAPAGPAAARPTPDAAAPPEGDVRGHVQAAAPPPRSVPDAAPLRPAPDPASYAPARGAPRWTDPGAVAAQEAQRARSDTDPPTSDLSSARLLRPTKRPPQSGWRRLVYVLSGRVINPGESPADIRRREFIARVNQPLLGCYKIGVLSLKGGVGKTTMTATLGATFASLRGDRVVAVDANPDRGTLSQKIPLETSATVRHLLRDAQRVRRYTDVRAYTSQGPSRLEVLASEQDPAVSEAFSEDDYRRTVTLLEHFYNIVLTDCGTGLMHSAMYGVLGVADQLIIVSSGSIDGARSASATMDWLDAHGHGDLVKNSVAVINCVHRSAGGVDLDRVAEHFAARCRSVVRIPFDAHLEEGAEVDLDRLEPGTRLALLELAAAVADAFDGAPG